MTNNQQQDKAKERAAEEAALLIEHRMTIGLGTGSTAAAFIKSLGKRCRQGLKVKAVATSNASAQLAKNEGIELISIDSFTVLDLTIDGADEVDPQKRLIKGAGGALLREKIIASSSKQMIVVVDESKMVNQLGQCPLPVEIIPFCYQATIYKLEQKKLVGALRKNAQGDPYLTDNQNYIFDIRFDRLLVDPEMLDQSIREIPGVVETGFFFKLATKIIVGNFDGTVTLKE